MAEQQQSPFQRVDNGYDPRQVAAFAAEALAWKRELTRTRAELDATKKALDRYESVIGSIEDVEREAGQIVEQAEHRASEIIEEAEDEAAKILEMARDQVASTVPSQDPAESPVEDADRWLTPEVVEDETPDPVDEIFTSTEVTEQTKQIEGLDPELERERRMAAAAANLWKRRGVLTPPE